MGTQKMTNILTLSATLVLVTLGVVSTSNAMPMNPNVGKIEARGICLECEIAQRDAGLNKTQKELLQMVSVISENGRDPREFQKRDGAGNPFAPIGTIESAAPINIAAAGTPPEMVISKASAFLVGPCLLLTNAHVISGNAAGPIEGTKYSMNFRAGEEGTPNAESASGEVVAYGDLTNGYNSNEDWALVELKPRASDNTCIGERLGWYNLPAVRPEVIAAGRYIAAGFFVDRSRTALSIQKNCKILPASLSPESLMRTTSPTVHGGSGGPIFQLSKSGAPNAFGMLAESADGSGTIYKTLNPKSVNHGVDLPAVRIQIMARIAADIKGKRNPLDTQRVATSL